MATKNLMLEVLKEIRDEVRQTNQRLDQTNERLMGVEVRMERVERRQTESEVRLSTQLVAVVQAVNAVKDLLATRLDVRDKLEDHEQRLVKLEHRAGP